MYLRTTQRRNKDGSVVRYVQLAHNRRVEGITQAEVLLNLGREDGLDRDGLARLVASINRYLGEPAPTGVPAGVAVLVGDGLRVTESRPMGTAYLLDGLWRQLGVDTALRKVLGPRRFTTDVERVLFALVANRAIDPVSKLAAAEWVTCDVAIPGLEEMDEDQAYRAMDLLVEADAQAGVQEAVFFAVADLLNLEVDVLLFDTTSTYFERDTEDVGDSGEPGFRRYGHSKDHRPDLPQIVIGLAVTREGIPVRCWCWPGNTNDQQVLPEVKDAMRDWRLGRVVTVVDRGFSSADNLDYLRRAGGHFIAGERMRSGAPLVEQALSRQGRYAAGARQPAGQGGPPRRRPGPALDHLPQPRRSRAREGTTRHRPGTHHRRARPDQDDPRHRRQEDQPRQRRPARPGRSAPTRPRTSRPSARCVTIPPWAGGCGSWPRDGWSSTAQGRRRGTLDGKYLLTTSDPDLSAEDIALGYKNLLEAERGFRDMKSTLDLRPVFHRLEPRIRAHVLLCWLALLLIRVAERRTGLTWRRIAIELGRVHAVTLTGPAGSVVHVTPLNTAQAGILRDCQVPPPATVTALHPA